MSRDGLYLWLAAPALYFGQEVVVRYFRTCYLIVIFCLIFSICPSAVPARAQGEKLVLAFYYSWFDWNTWQLPLSDQPTAPYLSSDPATIETHVVQAQQAGIDALVLDWYGPQVENNQTETNLRTLLDKAQIHGMSASLTVDIAGPFINSLDDLTNALVAVRDRHASHPAYLRVGGRPVVFFWRQEQYAVDTWLALRQQIDPEHTMIWIAEGTHPEYLAVFDGLYLYSVAWSADPASVLVRWGNEVRQWSQAQGAFRYWVATAMPGYNDSPTGRADAFAQARNSGVYYQATWDGARQSDADWVVITSFNEWLEGTQIEPTQSYGNLYLDLTAGLAAQYRQGVENPAVAEVVVTATLEPTPTPSPTAEPVEPTATATPLPTVTATLTPTATLSPTATPFRLPTPTVTIAAQEPASELRETSGDSGGEEVSETLLNLPQRYPVEGGASRSFPLWPVIGLVVLLALLAVVLLLRVRRF